MERATSMARASRVNSSITLSSLSSLPSLVWSNWKSRAQITSGRIGHMAPTGIPMPRNGRFFLR